MGRNAQATQCCLAHSLFGFVFTPACPAPAFLVPYVRPRQHVSERNFGVSSGDCLGRNDIQGVRHPFLRFASDDPDIDMTSRGRRRGVLS